MRRLQNVILLPRIERIKSCIIASRRVSLNETFAPLNELNGKIQVIVCCWHETIAGRKNRDIASTYTKVLKHTQNNITKHIKFWVDNCSGQNKNSALFTSFATMVNKPCSLLESITFAYFEPGPTFMSADSFHALVEKKIKNQKSVNTFDKFSGLIIDKRFVITMKCNDFKIISSGLSHTKHRNVPKLTNLRVIRFKRGF